METEGREGYIAYSPRPKDQCFLIKAVFKIYYIKLPALLNAWRLRQRIVQIQDFFLLKTFHIFKSLFFFNLFGRKLTQYIEVRGQIVRVFFSPTLWIQGMELVASGLVAIR